MRGVRPLLFLLISGLLPGQLSAALIIGNLGPEVEVDGGPSSSYLVGQIAPNTFTAATVFQAPANDFTISGGDVLLSMSAAGSANVTIELFSNGVGDLPGSSLLTIATVNVSGTSTTTYSFGSSDTTEVFAGGELYWLVLSSTTSPFVHWHRTSASTTGGPTATLPTSEGAFPTIPPFSTENSWVASDNGFDGFARSSNFPPGQFNLTGTVIPEPGVIGLLMGAMVFGVLLLRRRRT